MIDVGRIARCDVDMAGIVEGLRKVGRSVARSLGQLFGAEAAEGENASNEAGPWSREGAGSASATGLRFGSDPRRYKRALLLTGQSGIQQDLASASVQFRGKPYVVVDLSHAGVAIERGDIPIDEILDPSKSESVVLNVGMLEPFSAQVTMARSSPTIVAFEFLEVTTDGRLTIDRFLDPKMIGLNMRPVDRAFFSPGETFSLWFCGPRDTNFFLWMNGSKLERAIIQLGDEQFTLAPNAGAASGVRFVRHNVHGMSTRLSVPTDLRDSVLFALDVALQVKNGGDAIAGLVKLLTEAADTLPPGS